ncbi:MAG: HD domain-containing phosphohydrolase, partial [Candidatus Latescibacteria bacterium]|nr:HD domain-containing phosphohydrolase [Candidatus Latescibacterota bacterium]
LFNAFIETTAAAIDEKSPYTAGHVRRVSKLTMMIARGIDQAKDGIWQHIHFTTEELEELRIAAWMHDVGKMTTPEYVVDKATKLETIYDRIKTVKTRYEVFLRDAEIAALNQNVALANDPEREAKCAEIDAALEREQAALREELDFVVACNTGSEFMEDEDIHRLENIAARTFEMGGEMLPQLSDNETYNLLIRKGTLTDEERQVINNHAAVSLKMLSQLPFSKTLRRVPEYAGGHHEMLDGKGYPQGLAADQLPLQARILAVADIFEALTASDRPYRKPIPLSQAMEIMGFMVKDGELDSKIVALMEETGVLKKYVEEELNAEQLGV